MKIFHGFNINICIITRAGPAKCLGLKDKGHLGVGADADVTVYDMLEDIYWKW